MSLEREKAIELVNSFKLILMDEDTECGNEIIKYKNTDTLSMGSLYWKEVKQELELL